MIKVFVLTMMFATNEGAGGITTTDFPVYDDCHAAARAFVRNGKIATVTYVNAWCSTKNIPEKETQQ